MQKLKIGDSIVISSAMWETVKVNARKAGIVLRWAENGTKTKYGGSEMRVWCALKNQSLAPKDVLLRESHDLIRTGLTVMEEDGNSLYEAEKMLATQLGREPLT